MKTKTSSVAEAVRLQQWGEQIKECQNRPAELKVDDWCRLHGITKSNYYYRLRRVRQAVLDCSAEKEPECTQCQGFVELPVPANSVSSMMPIKQTTSDGMTGSVVTAVIRGCNGISIDVFRDTTPEMLYTLMRALSHA